jgi:hypothetical protein
MRIAFVIMSMAVCFGRVFAEPGPSKEIVH